jgi:hypothetical protein
MLSSFIIKILKNNSSKYLKANKPKVESWYPSKMILSLKICHGIKFQSLFKQVKYSKLKNQSK